MDEVKRLTAKILENAEKRHYMNALRWCADLNIHLLELFNDALKDRAHEHPTETPEVPIPEGNVCREHKAEGLRRWGCVGNLAGGRVCAICKEEALLRNESYSPAQEMAFRQHEKHLESDD